MRALILHNIRSNENVGSMFRTADAFKIDKIYLTGYTPAPLDRFNRPVTKIAKTALGAEKTVAWQKTEDVGQLIQSLKIKNVRIIALEQDERAVDLNTYAAPDSWALVVGNEVTGVEPEVLAFVDDIVEIPMQGAKESLNVAVATGIALHQLT